VGSVLAGPVRLRVRHRVGNVMTRKRRLPKDVPYHTERLWALIQVHHDRKPKETVMMYLLAPTRRALWDAVVDNEFYGTGHTKVSLQELGWVAREVFVEEVAK
jgi:hypothetical protein